MTKAKRGPGQPVKEEHRKAILTTLRRAKNGRTLQELVAKTGVPERTVYRWLQRLPGVERVPETWPVRYRIGRAS